MFEMIRLVAYVQRVVVDSFGDGTEASLVAWIGPCGAGKSGALGHGEGGFEIGLGTNGDQVGDEGHGTKNWVYYPLDKNQHTDGYRVSFHTKSGMVDLRGFRDKEIPLEGSEEEGGHDEEEQERETRSGKLRVQHKDKIVYSASLRAATISMTKTLRQAADILLNQGFYLSMRQGGYDFAGKYSDQVSGGVRLSEGAGLTCISNMHRCWTSSQQRTLFASISSRP